MFKISTFSSIKLNKVISRKEVDQENMIVTLHPEILLGISLMDITIQKENEIRARIVSTASFAIAKE